MNNDSPMNDAPAAVNFVTPYGDKSQFLRRDNTAIERIAASVMNVESSTPAEVDASAIRAMETVSEKSTPLARAWATAILGGVMLLAIGGVILTLWLVGVGGAAIGATFIVVVVVSVIVLLWLNAEYSPIGGERYKARTYQHIRRMEIEADVQKSHLKYRAFIEMMERIYERG